MNDVLTKLARHAIRAGRRRQASLLALRLESYKVGLTDQNAVRLVSEAAEALRYYALDKAERRKFEDDTAGK